MYEALRRLTVITIVSVLFYVSGSYVFDEIYSKNVFVSGTWHQPPQIVICKESRIPISSVLNGIEFWKSKSFKIDHYIIDYDDYVCNQSFPLGFILIRHDGSMPVDSVGVTRRMIITSNIISAEIIIPNSEVNVPLILEHELGHALGLNHVNVVGHIMNPYIDRSGKKYWVP
jgi:hypothetical protein